MAVRITLTKSVLQALPSYIMQSVALPISVCEEIDRRCRNFIWGDSEGIKKIHTVSWAKVCESKNAGGLGLRSARAVNKAFLLKGCWNLCLKKDALWAAVIRSKYKCGIANLPKIARSKIGSNFWKGLCDNWDLFLESIIWKPGNGIDIRFWSDSWVPNQNPLKEQVTEILEEQDLQSKLCEYIQPSGEWNLMLFSSKLCNQTNDRIKASRPPKLTYGRDTFTWKYEANGMFSLTSAYTVASGRSAVKDQLFRTLWRWKGPERIRILLWKAALGMLLTNSLRAKRRLTTDQLCPRCRTSEESVEHVLRDCIYSKQVWSALGLPQIQPQFYNMQYRDWLLVNLRTKTNIGGLRWNILFGVTLDSVWHQRNELCFKQVQPECIPLVMRCINLTHQITSSSLEYYRKVMDHPMESRLNHHDWTPPRHSSLKLNSVSIAGEGTDRGCRGIIRDCNGNLIVAYAKKIDAGSALKAGCEAILIGVHIAWARGMRALQIESNNEQVINMLKNGHSNAKDCNLFISSIDDLSSQGGSYTWGTVHEDANQVVYALAKFGRSIEGQGRIFDSVFSFFSVQLLADCNGSRQYRVG